jgi:hypothetical protein
MNFDEEIIEFACGDCGKMISVTVAWLKLNSEYECDCETINELDATELLAGYEELDLILNKLTKKNGF